MTSMRRNDVASTSFRRHVPTRFLINPCQIIIFLILKSDIIENSRIELRGIVLPVPSNLINVAFIIILPFNLVYLWFFPVSHRNWRKRWVDYWGGGGGGQRVCWPHLSNYLGGSGPPGPPSSYAYDIATPNSECRSSSYYLSDTVLPEQAGLVNWDRRIWYKSSFQSYFTRKIKTSFGDMPVCRLG